MKDATNYKPFGRYVVLSIPQVTKETPSGIIKSKEMMIEEQSDWDGSAEVIRVGPECNHCKVGARVLIQDQAPMYPISKTLNHLVQVDEYHILGYFE